MHTCDSSIPPPFPGCSSLQLYLGGKNSLLSVNKKKKKKKKKKKLEHRSKPHALAVPADNLACSNVDSDRAPHITTAHLHHCTIHNVGQRALRRLRRRQVVHKLSFVDQCILYPPEKDKKKAMNERQFKNFDISTAWVCRSQPIILKTRHVAER